MKPNAYGYYFAVNWRLVRVSQHLTDIHADLFCVHFDGLAHFEHEGVFGRVSYS